MTFKLFYKIKSRKINVDVPDSLWHLYISYILVLSFFFAYTNLWWIFILGTILSMLLLLLHDYINRSFHDFLVVLFTFVLTTLICYLLVFYELVTIEPTFEEDVYIAHMGWGKTGSYTPIVTDNLVLNGLKLQETSTSITQSNLDHISLFCHDLGLDLSRQQQVVNYINIDPDSNKTPLIIDALSAFSLKYQTFDTMLFNINNKSFGSSFPLTYFDSFKLSYPEDLSRIVKGYDKLSHTYPTMHESKLMYWHQKSVKYTQFWKNVNTKALSNNISFEIKLDHTLINLGYRKIDLKWDTQTLPLLGDFFVTGMVENLLTGEKKELICMGEHKKVTTKFELVNKEMSNLNNKAIEKMREHPNKLFVGCVVADVQDVSELTKQNYMNAPIRKDFANSFFVINDYEHLGNVSDIAPNSKFDVIYKNKKSLITKLEKATSYNDIIVIYSPDNPIVETSLILKEINNKLK